MSKCKYCKKKLIVPLHIQKGFHISCKQKKDRDELEGAKKNIAANKAPNASFVQGGSTGLVQQKGRIRASNTYKKSGIKKEIKDTLKMHGYDLVIMQIGSTYDSIEEDADFFHKHFGHRYNPATTAYNQTGFPIPMIAKIKEKLLGMNIKFCIVDEIDLDDPDNDPSSPSPSGNGRIIRKIAFSSFSTGASDLIFVGGPKS